jgi:hypothetical protein
MGIGRFVYTPILPPMMASLGMSKSDAGLIASANFAGYLAGAFYLARAQLPGSRRAWLLGALLASAATTAAMGLTESMVWFMGLRFLGGVASAPVLILSSALVLDRLAETSRSRLARCISRGSGWELPRRPPLSRHSSPPGRVGRRCGRPAAQWRCWARSPWRCWYRAERSSPPRRHCRAGWGTIFACGE